MTALPDPKTLTKAEKEWLERIARRNLYRVRDGFRAVADPRRLSLKLYERLREKGLIAMETRNGRVSVRPTYIGRVLLAHLEAEAERRAGR